MIRIAPIVLTDPPTPTATPEPTSSATPTEQPPSPSATPTAQPTETASPVPVDMATTEGLLQQMADFIPFLVVASCIIVILLAITAVMAVRR